MKKKKKSPGTPNQTGSKKRNAPDKITPGTFGELLIAAQKKDVTPTQAVVEKIATTPVPPPEPVILVVEEAAPLTDLDVFSQAVEGLSPKDIYTGKFGRPDDVHWTPPRIVEDVSVEQVKEVQEIRYFQREVGQLQRRFKDGKYYVPEKHHIDDSEQESVRRRFERICKGRSVPELDLHDVTSKDVLEILEGFVLDAQIKGAKFVRIIHGKGKNSTGAPVLKPLVLQWMNTSRLCCGNAPVIEADDDFGVTILELRRPNP
jgi:DNA-nicking Smr family endonuclease